MYFVFTVMMSPTPLWFIPLAVAGLSFAFLWPIARRLFRRCDPEEITADWLDEFRPSVYYPMQELLSDEDFRFLSRQPGFDLSLYKKLRRERLRIFEQYLNRLISDFNRLHTAARMLLVMAPDDQSQLLTRLIWLKVQFSVSVLQAEFSVWLCRIGFQTLAARATIARLEEMSEQLNRISSARFA